MNLSLLGLVDTLDSIELVWLGLVAPGFLVHLAILYEAIQDRIFMRKSGHKGRRWVVASSGLRREILRTTSSLMMLSVGIVSAYRPATSAPPSGARTSTIVFLMVLASADLLNAVLDYRIRFILREENEA